MKIIKSMLLVLSGTVFGIGFVLSCGENSPQRSDAATCDCPASEPPIAGRVVAKASPPVTIGPGESDLAGVGCDSGTQLISGACEEEGESAADNITLQQSAPNSQLTGWNCVFKNNEAVPVPVKAVALCLKLAM